MDEDYSCLIKSIMYHVSPFFSWAERVGIITSREDGYAITVIHNQARLERQGLRAILRTMEYITCGTDQTRDISEHY